MTGHLSFFLFFFSDSNPIITMTQNKINHINQPSSIVLSPPYFNHIVGFFMFRKFLKRLPKEDGRSELDWQDYYIEKSRHLCPHSISACFFQYNSPANPVLTGRLLSVSVLKIFEWLK
jgi:hypothetical protein